VIFDFFITFSLDSFGKTLVLTLDLISYLLCKFYSMICLTSITHRHRHFFTKILFTKICCVWTSSHF